MKLYRQVSTTERLPEKEGYVLLDDGQVWFREGKFYEIDRDWIEVFPDVWLEEFSLRTKEEIKKSMREFYSSDEIKVFLEGANYIINLIKNK